MAHVDGSIQTLTCCSLLSDADTDEKFSKVSRKINFFAGIIVRVYLYTILLLVQNVVFVGCSFTSSGLSPQQSHEDSADNITGIRTLLYEMFDTVEEQLMSGVPISLTTSGDQSFEQQYLEHLYQEYHTSKSRQLYLVSENRGANDIEAETTGLSVTLSAREIGVSYKRNDHIENEKKKLSRIIEVQIFCNVVDRKTGGVLFAKTIMKSSEDHIDENDIPAIQNSNLPFTIGVLPEQGRLREFIEIGSVMSVAGAILFILFAVRS
jgi:hypothetical protein